MSSAIQTSTLLFLIVSWIFTCQATDNLDCRRMVFHPKCRGISAKRSSSIPFFEDADKQYNSDDSLESSNWKNEIDSDLVERIMRDIFFANMKMKSHGHSYYDEEK